MATKYRFKRIAADEFAALKQAADISLNYFIFLTGRHATAVLTFLNPEGRDSDRSPYHPTMGDILILELLKKQPDLLPDMLEICHRYNIDTDQQLPGLGAMPAELKPPPREAVVIRKRPGSRFTR